MEAARDVLKQALFTISCISVFSGCDRYCDQQLSAGLAWRRKGYFKGRRTLFSDLCLLFALFGTECAGRQYAAEQRQYESARYFKFPAVSSGCLV